MSFAIIHDYDFAVTKLIKEMFNFYYDLRTCLDIEQDVDTINYRRGLVDLYMILVIDIGHD